VHVKVSGYRLVYPDQELAELDRPVSHSAILGVAFSLKSMVSGSVPVEAGSAD